MYPQPSGPNAPVAARQPFTWGGVAAFAGPVSVLWLVWVLGVALLVGAAAERFVKHAWLPALEAAVRHLPASSSIVHSRLIWPSNTVAELGKTSFLAVRVNPQSTPVPGQAADVEVELGAGEVSVRSLFGYWILPYPASLEFALNRPALEPLWATSAPYGPAGGLVASAGAVGLSWALLALLAAPVLRVAAAALRREVTFGGCWRMAMVAMLPGALLVAAALLLYADGGFRLVDFVIAFGLGHLLSLALLAGAPWCLPRRVPVPLFALGGTPAGPGAGAPVVEPGVGSRGSSPFAGPAVAAVPPNPFAVAPTASGEEPPRPMARPEPPPRPCPEPPSDEPLNPS